MFSMTCDAIAEGGKFPELFLGPGHGANVAPVLRWTGAPAATQGFALTLADDDAPDYVHLVVVLGADAAEFNVFTTDSSMVIGQGTRMFGYEGPCPPGGVHHYRFTLRALSAVPDLKPGFCSDQLEAAIAGSVIGTATLEASYNADARRLLGPQGSRVVGFLRRLRQPAMMQAAA